MNKLTVTELRKYLDDLENTWNQDVEKHFGKFGHQTIMVDIYRPINEVKNTYEYSGIGHAKTIYNATIGILILPAQ